MNLKVILFRLFNNYISSDASESCRGYVLRRGTSEFHFRPIEHLHRREVDGKVYYLLSFMPFFFDDRDELFEQLFAEQNN